MERLLTPLFPYPKEWRQARRVVRYATKKHMAEHAGVDEKLIPFQWVVWLRKARKEPPTIEELERDVERIRITRHNAKVLELRDAQQRERRMLERSQEHDRAMARQIESPTVSEPSTSRAATSGRRMASAVPTSEVSDEMADEERAQRLAAERTVSRSDGPALRQERLPDNDVWAASRARMQAQDAAREGDEATSSSEPFADAKARREARRQARTEEAERSTAETERARKQMSRSVLSDFEVDFQEDTPRTRR